MVESLVSGVAEKLLIDLGSHAIQEIGSAVGVKKDLEKLKETMTTINAVLVDAEEKQLNSHEIRTWLRRIRNASYEADDIFDDFAIEAQRRQLMNQQHQNNTIKRKVLNFTYSIKSVPFRFEMSSRIKDVRQKFVEIATDRAKFHLNEKVSLDMKVQDAEREQTHSFVDELQVFGREGDKHEILNLLLGMEVQDNLSVVAIQGMGGLGKTTLAQLVYNDNRMNRNFDSKMWVCVAQHFDVKDIIGKILASATNTEGPNLEIDQLQSRLRQQLQGKRFLLVLDDVWNEDEEKWDKLRTLLIGGAKGSKVLITTRSGKVASIMGALAATYCLKSLSEDDCWELFKKRAFAKGEEEVHPNLVAIGKEIVRKCGGVPLAAKSLGSLMRFKTEEHEWTSVKENDIWKLPHKANNILPALRLSYNHLPADLKQCFAYCFSIQKGLAIFKDDLIQMWIAQGFIMHPSGDYQCLYNIGEEYVKELLWRSFFQVVDRYSVEMHDLIHDLARDVAAGTECFIWEKGKTVLSSKEVRHVTFSDLGESVPHEYLGSLRGLSNLRTLEFHPPPLVYNFFSHFRCLRVLRMKIGWGDCPSSIGKLKHLRYLAIASKHIQTLHKSVARLRCLETLSLHCPKLRRLPSDICKMVHLRYIYLDTEAPLSYMPSGLQNLTSLRELRLFAVGKGIGCKLKDLRGLIHLGGKLRITNLENVNSATESAEGSLKERHIQELQLFWKKEDISHGHASGNKTFVAVLESLQPHQNIEVLVVSGYPGASFPRWLMEPLFPKIASISLLGCEKCTHLPPFWELPSLKILVLQNMDALRSTESGAWSGHRLCFPSLMELQLSGVPNLESLTPAAHNGIEGLKENLVSFPSLENLILERCSEKLVCSLLILGKDNPRSSSPNSSLSKLKSLEIKYCDDLEYLPNAALQSLTSLEKLKVISCRNLTIDMNSLSMGYFFSLKTLILDSLPKLESLPEGIQNAVKLQQLTMYHCEGLMNLPDWMGNLTSLRVLSIHRCPQLKFLPDGMQQLITLELLMIVGCTGLMSWPNWLGSFTSLRELVISCSSKLPFLPEQLQNLSCLRILHIEGSNVLTSLPEWMVNLTRLHRLLLWNCGEHLASRCQEDTGEDWPKISHIPIIKII